ncbi:MAG: beta-lactamase family protein [Planctomycetes bacterium]|nr:beta-lactamase family protein [Planctomycetota bacterium]
MTRKKLAPASIALLLAFGCASAEVREVPQASPAAPAAQKLRKIDGVVEEMIEKNKLAGAVILVAKDGEVVFTGTYGKMDLEASKPMRPDAIFRIYSMTKAIVTAAALILVDEGKLKLDAPIGDSIPELKDLQVYGADGNKKPARPPTVKDLMLHTAGFLYGNADRPAGKLYQEKKPLEAGDLDEFARRLAALPLAYEPGKDWVYSMSIEVLGLVVERVSGKKLDRFLEERIFKPLDMKDSGFYVPAEKADRFAANYQRGPSGLKVIDAPRESKYLKPPGLLSGGGGLVSTARDYLRFLLMVEGGGEFQGRLLLARETVGLMTTNQLPKEAFPIYFGKEIRHATGFGLGFSVRTADSAWDPQARVGEYGWGGAASTHYWTSPKDRIVVVTMEQTMPYSFDTEFALKGLIYDALLKP